MVIYGSPPPRKRGRRGGRTKRRRLPRWGGRGFWGFQGSCERSLAAARALGMTTVVEFPGIPDAIATGFLQGVEATGERVPAGLREQADHYIAASSFSARCLESAGAPRGREG